MNEANKNAEIAKKMARAVSARVERIVEQRKATELARSEHEIKNHLPHIRVIAETQLDELFECVGELSRALATLAAEQE